MTHHLDHTIALLARTPVALDALLRDLPDVWTLGNEGPNTWNVRGVVAHLIHGEHTDWLPRVRMVLEHGASKAFEPFDRQGHEASSASRSLAQLLDAFTEARRASLADLRALALTDADLERRGRHPVLGDVTLSQLLATWAAHDLTHLHQLSRVMAYQYRESVGPWRRYLGVLHCAGHGE
jgi:hypothetical protein